MDHRPMLPLGLATLLLAGSGQDDDGPVVLSASDDGMAPEQSLAQGIVHLQGQIVARQRRSDLPKRRRHEPLLIYLSGRIDWHTPMSAEAVLIADVIDRALFRGSPVG